MDQVPGTPSLLRAINDRTALQLLSEQGPLTRARLGALTGLSKPTATQLMDRLEAAGLVEALPGEGRTARLYRVRPGAAYVAGIDVTPARLRVRLCDLTGEIIAETSLATPRREVKDAVDRVREALTEACAAAGITVPQLNRVVIGLGGAPDPQTGRIRYAPHLPGWHDPNLPARLRSELTGQNEPDPAVDVENDVNLAAIAEQSLGVTRKGAPLECRDFAVLWIGDGIGAAIVIDGRLHRGYTGGAGELGYMPVSGQPLTRNIRRNVNGGFQSIGGAPAVLKLARSKGFSGSDAATAVRRAAEAGPLGTPLLQELAERLAVGLAPLVAVIDPELIVLTGAMLQAGGEPLRELMTAALHDIVIPRPKLVLSELAEAPVLAGAIESALAQTKQELFDNTRRGNR
ncbi:ROK family transcriptional regulator [Actinospica sp. MGRD01-02]|uniref:ROK family transcriptional regulator n=1 Tax=Actinospica acidithermotolerans TaxID=2828514 RepID=A0A941E6C2_9ACTN|nr:ROK family transcriptional regulator [Actinospica acidithermotolerans]MBR7827165.1 ROK family transcriptional regulator [Actinospica acidithermotolerans]